MNIVYRLIILIGLLCFANIYTITTYSSIWNEAIQVTDYKTALQMDIIWGSKQKLPGAPSLFDALATNPVAILVISLFTGGFLIVFKRMVHSISNGKKGPVTDAVDKAAKNLSSPSTKFIDAAGKEPNPDPTKTAELNNEIKKVENSGNAAEQAKLKAATEPRHNTETKSSTAPRTILESIKDFFDQGKPASENETEMENFKVKGE